MRVVLDTNVLISAYFFPGSNPDIILRLAKNRAFVFITSEHLLKEFAGVLLKKFSMEAQLVSRISGQLRNSGEVITPEPPTIRATKNRGDNRVLACAVAGGTDYLVTGDRKHLLPLKVFRGITIVSPTEFLALFT